MSSPTELSLSFAKSQCFTINDYVEHVEKVYEMCSKLTNEANNYTPEYSDKLKAFQACRTNKVFPYPEWANCVRARADQKSAFQQYEKIRRFDTAHVGIREITRAKWRSTTPDICGICLETHTMRDSVMTSCKHYFGKECFYNWIQNNLYKKTCSVVCPLCRANDYTLFKFTAGHNK